MQRHIECRCLMPVQDYLTIGQICFHARFALLGEYFIQVFEQGRIMAYREFLPRYLFFHIL